VRARLECAATAPPIDELPHLDTPGTRERDIYQAEIDKLRDFISDRMDWIDGELEAGRFP